MTRLLEIVYSDFPEDKASDLSQIAKIESGEWNVNILRDKRTWLQICLYFKKDTVAHMILDCFQIPNEGISLKERLALYQLLGSDTDKD